MMMRWTTPWLILGVACGSCSPSAPSAKRPAGSAAVAPPKSPVIPQIVQGETDTFVYSAIGKRDPFRSPLDDLIVNHVSEGRCPLCRWQVDQLKLVAVITGTGSPMAMVEDPNGVGHVVRQGMVIGKQAGRVSTIQRDQLVVTETSHDPFGKLIRSRILLKIEQPREDAREAASLLNE